MFMGLFGSGVGVRLGEAARAELGAIAGSGPFGPEDRPMKEYATLPPAWRRDPESTTIWVEAALDHTAAMPPKAKK